jgi:hypothetical protein
MALSGRSGQSASTLAQQTLDEEERKKKEKAKKAQAQKDKKDVTGKGAEASASAGMAAGPVGALIGAGVGAAAGAVDANQREKAAGDDPNRPKHRRLAKATEIAQDKKRSKERALATLSQAVFDWAASIR